MAVTLQARVQQLRASAPQIERKLMSACEDAALCAVATAMELTPPAGDISGTHTRTGEMKQDWAASSAVKPVRRDGRYESLLANQMEYASYVNDGHRMDRHFVPGLYINEESGLLEYDPALAVSREQGMKRGIMVGTKTRYVPGIFMVDAAGEEYKRVLRQELADIGEILE